MSTNPTAVHSIAIQPLSRSASLRGRADLLAAPDLAQGQDPRAPREPARRRRRGDPGHRREPKAWTTSSRSRRRSTSCSRASSETSCCAGRFRRWAVCSSTTPGSSVGTPVLRDQEGLQTRCHDPGRPGRGQVDGQRPRLQSPLLVATRPRTGVLRGPGWRHAPPGRAPSPRRRQRPRGQARQRRQRYADAIARSSD